MYVCIYVSAYDHREQRNSHKGHSHSHKGAYSHRRQGIVLKDRNSLQRSLYPVVVCPYLCSSHKLESFGTSLMGAYGWFSKVQSGKMDPIPWEI